MRNISTVFPIFNAILQFTQKTLVLNKHPLYTIDNKSIREVCFMRKTHKLITFAAVALQLLAFLVFLIIIIFQRSFEVLMNSPHSIIDIFSFPIASTLYMLSLTVAILLVVLGLFFKGRNIIPELLCIVMLVLICPLISRIGSTLETALIARKGSEQLAAFSSLSSLTNFAFGFTDVASALALVACGIGMVLKKTPND